MTIQELNDFLTSRVGGVGAATRPEFAKVASTAILGAYNHVWGAYRWTVRRAQETLTANAPTTNCPELFERARWISCQVSGRKRHILIRSEEAFDMSHPYPSDDSTGLPSECKIVYNAATPTDSWKIYWWRVPDAAYSMVLAYDRKADIQFFEKLPSYMIKAVQAQALSLVMSADVNGGNLEQLATHALKEAIYADTEVSGVFPIFGKDSEWDNWDSAGSGGHVAPDTWNALNW